MKIDEKLSPLFFQNSWLIDCDQIKRLNEHYKAQRYSPSYKIADCELSNS